MRYHVLQDNEWVRLALRGQKEACCECSLVHDMDFKIVIKSGKKELYCRVKRNNRSTAIMRAHTKKNKPNVIS